MMHPSMRPSPSPSLPATLHLHRCNCDGGCRGGGQFPDTLTLRGVTFQRDPFDNECDIGPYARRP